MVEHQKKRNHKHKMLAYRFYSLICRMEMLINVIWQNLKLLMEECMLMFDTDYLSDGLHSDWLTVHQTVCLYHY